MQQKFKIYFCKDFSSKLSLWENYFNFLFSNHALTKAVVASSMGAKSLEGVDQNNMTDSLKGSKEAMAILQ